MNVRCRCMIFSMIRSFVWFIFIFFSVCHVQSLDKNDKNQANQTIAIPPGEATHENLRMVRALLMKLNKPGIKTIKSPDGDIIDCILYHEQPTFDHPDLKLKKSLDLPESRRPNGYNSSTEATEDVQLWSMSGDSCPEGAIPIKRITEEDILRANSISTFGRKPIPKSTYGRSNIADGHEYAVGIVRGTNLYGGKASLNVWAPTVEDQHEFSISQIWVVAGPFGDLNTIEAGWQVGPLLFKDRQPRLFVYWTRDGYKETGCYNLLCSGFVQTSKKIAIGAAISPKSSYGGAQFEISLLIFKDLKTGNWWLQCGSEFVGYWPSSLFTHLKFHASTVQFGGEIFNTKKGGLHTSTQMGSGHFPEEGNGKASFIRNLQVVDYGNSLITPPNLQLSVDHPNCYGIKGGVNSKFGTYIYYGGPGRNPKCP